MSRIHCIEHAAFESPGRIAEWATARGHEFTSTRLYDGETLPAAGAVDAWVVMGGPMSVHDDDKFVWLANEKRVLEDVLRLEKPLLGVCLGAQLVAHVLGARVYRNRFQEIGWFPVEATDAGREGWGLPPKFVAFHWHGDTFELPRDAVHLAKSDACTQQMFAWGSRVLGVQFHLEPTAHGVAEFVRCGEDLPEGPYVQSPTEMTASHRRLDDAHALLDRVLDRWIA